MTTTDNILDRVPNRHWENLKEEEIRFYFYQLEWSAQDICSHTNRRNRRFTLEEVNHILRDIIWVTPPKDRSYSIDQFYNRVVSWERSLQESPPHRLDLIKTQSPLRHPTTYSYPLYCVAYALDFDHQLGISSAETFYVSRPKVDRPELDKRELVEWLINRGWTLELPMEDDGTN